MARTFAGCILLFMLGMTISTPLAQDSVEPCSPRDVVYPLVKSAILDEASYTGVRVRHAAAGERLDIIGSKRFGPWCWLQVSDGWLIDSARALSSEPPDTVTAPPSASAPGCYEGEKAYVVGNMNIRAGASTRSQVVAHVDAGDFFTVSNSILDLSWCWLKIDLGWLANTSRVLATKPARLVATASAAPSAIQPANIDNCCFVDRQCATDQEWGDGFWAYQRNECGAPEQTSSPLPSDLSRPRIEGSPEFVRFITDTLDLLAVGSTRWYRYVVDQTNVIIEGDPGDPRDCGANVYASARRVTVQSDCQTFLDAHIANPYRGNLINMASILAHEACHVYHHDHGKTYPEGLVREELECNGPLLATEWALEQI